MMNALPGAPRAPIIAERCPHEEALFSAWAEALRQRGYCIAPDALPPQLCERLAEQARCLPAEAFRPAAVGRRHGTQRNRFVRSDTICWIAGDSDAGAEWLMWCGRLQRFLNRALLLGLFSFESHFAHYAPGDFYRRHRDAFRGEANRVLSLVTYLNPGWRPEDGGELVLYRNDADRRGVRVTPALGTLVLFLSEDFPHEVLPARRNRLSVAGWFRVNGSHAGRVDPPR